MEAAGLAAARPSSGPRRTVRPPGCSGKRGRVPPAAGRAGRVRPGVREGGAERGGRCLRPVSKSRAGRLGPPGALARRWPPAAAAGAVSGAGALRSRRAGWGPGPVRGLPPPAGPLS